MGGPLLPGPRASRCTVVVALPRAWPGARESVDSALAQAGVGVVLSAADPEAARTAIGDRDVTWIAPGGRSSALGALCEAGLRAAVSPYVLFLPAGDRLAPGCVERQLDRCAGRPEIDVVFSRCEPLEGGSEVPARPSGEKEMLEALLRGRPWPLASGLIRRASLLAVGGMDPLLDALPECDLWLRLVVRGGVAVADDAEVRVRWPRPGAAAEAVAAERSLAVAGLVDRFGSRWLRPPGSEDGAPSEKARANARLELATALLRSGEPEAGPLAQRLVREARRLGAPFPEGTPFDELRFLLPRLADAEPGVELGENHLGRRGPGAASSAPRPFGVRATSVRRREKLVVVAFVATEAERRHLDRALEWWRELAAGGDVELVAALPRGLLAGVDRWIAAGLHVEPLERLAWGDGEAELMLERIGADAVLAPDDSALGRAAAALGLPRGPALPEFAAEESGAAGFASRIESLVLGTSSGDLTDDIARLEAEVAAERRRQRALARLAADLAPALEVIERWMVRPVLREGPFRKLAAMAAEADRVRSLAERVRDFAERTHEKLRIGRRLRSTVRTLLGQEGLARRGYAISGSPLERFLDRLAERPDTWLWVIYTTDPFSELRGQRSTWLARELLRRGHAVVFCYWRWTLTEAIAESPSPDLLSLPIDRLRAAWPALAAAARPRAQKIFLMEFPDEALFELLGLANASGFVTLYDCVDDWSEFARLGQARWYDAGVERFLTVQSDVALATHPLLRSRLAELAGRDVALVPNGFDRASLGIRRSRREPTGAPVVGYFGHLADAWFDWDLLRETARRRSDLRFDVIGFGEPSGLELPENVHLLGAVPHELLAERARRWDVATVPFREGPLARAVDPIKVYEYLALGLPVVAVGMPHLAATPGVVVCDAPGFAAALDEALRTPFDEDAVERFLRGSEWCSRVDQILGRVARVELDADVLKVLAG